ncbi:hypothetical protein PVAG01_04733 [Phlyctema vagabunda]|uniref:Uncharacterized protein n=1 Tax=Phlyctema vagabunda TaxID=108571 RepID=A0ABR4PI20_9HELO
MHITNLLTSAPLLLVLSNTAQAQVAAGGGAAGTAAATQMATLTTAATHVIVGGSTSVAYLPYTQTFATGALGTWAFGSVTSAGTIGLGTIEGSVGVVKSKRALPTPPAVQAS